MSKRASCRRHRVTLHVGLEEQTAGLVCYPAALAQTLLHHPRGLGSRTRTVTGDGPDSIRLRDASGKCMVAGIRTFRSSTGVQGGEKNFTLK